MLLFDSVALYSSPFSVERQEAEPAGIKHAGDGDSQQTQGMCGDDQSRDLQQKMPETEHQLSGGKNTRLLDTS